MYGAVPIGHIHGILEMATFAPARFNSKKLSRTIKQGVE
jgi:hypothetical protein